MSLNIFNSIDETTPFSKGKNISLLSHNEEECCQVFHFKEYVMSSEGPKEDFHDKPLCPPVNHYCSEESLPLLRGKGKEDSKEE